MYSSLIDAPVNTELTILSITRPSLERWLQRLGLFKGAHLFRHAGDFHFHPVRVRGAKGDVILPAGLAMKIFVHLDSGEKIPLTEMERNARGHMEIHSGGKFVRQSLERLGLAEEGDLTFIRSLPHMDYIAVIDRKERTRLSEGEAARIWGRSAGGEETQFYFAKKGVRFAVEEIMGGPRTQRHLETHGIAQGRELLLESIEQAQTLHEPRSQPVTVSSPGGLRLYLTPEKAGAVIVRSD